MEYKHTLLRIGKISGVLYSCGRRKRAIVIYAIGAPRVPDNGRMPEAVAALEHGVDFFIPDYMGYGRSGGTFTPLNCIRTLTSLYHAFIRGCSTINHSCRTRTTVKYNRVVFLGKSFGGRYVPLLPKFDRKITELGLICPALNTSLYGKAEMKEESIQDFVRSMKYDGYSNLYRGVLGKNDGLSREWNRHLHDRDTLAPLANLEHLEDARVFIAHGKLDRCINFSRSVSYYKKLRKTFPAKGKNSLRLSIYDNGDHGDSTATHATKEFINWIIHGAT